MIRTAGNFSTSSNKDVSCQSILQVLLLCWNCKNFLNQDFLLLYFRGVFLGNADSSEKKIGIPAAPPSGNIRKSCRVPRHRSSDPIQQYSNVATQIQIGVGMCQKKHRGFSWLVSLAESHEVCLLCASCIIVFSLYYNLKDYLQSSVIICRVSFSSKNTHCSGLSTFKKNKQTPADSSNMKDSNKN